MNAFRTRLLLAALTATLLLAAGGAIPSAVPAFADETGETSETYETPQTEFTGAVGYGFATAMSTDGTTAVVGQLGDSKFEDVPGVAHVLSFDGTEWTQQAELTAGDSSYDMLFGNAVAASADGNTVIVGDPGECGYGLNNCEHGAAYVFVRDGSTWTQQEELHGGPGFGGAVALSSDGNTALVGAGLSGYYGFSYSPAGNAPPTIFKRSGETWTQEATLSATGASGEFDNLGHSVALSADGHTALIGDPTQAEESGAAYVFTAEGSTWTEQAELSGSDVKKQWNFGASVAISADGHKALVGAPAPEAGTAYVFSGTGPTWTQQAELTPDDEEVKGFDGWFGDSVALNGEGDVALVGAPWAEEDLGAAYAFAGEGSNWSQQAEFTLFDATPYDYFGGAVALDGEGNVALIGRYDPGVDFFKVPPPHILSPPPGKEPTESPTPKEPLEPTVPTAPTGRAGPVSSGPPTTPHPTAAAPASGAGTSADAFAREVGASSVTFTPESFQAAPHRPSTTGARHGGYGAEVDYMLDMASEVRFTIAKVEEGRRSGGRCQAETKANPRAARCVRLARVAGSFTRRGEAGVNRFRFTGRWAGHTLPAGNYRLIATPFAGGEVGHAAQGVFEIER